MPHRVFYNVDLAAWVYGTIEKHRQGVSWPAAWFGTYEDIGGVSRSIGTKGCPMTAARTLYEFGRIKNGGMPFRDCDILELWNLSKNGTYAILATRLLHANSDLSKASLWREIQQTVRRDVGEEPARTDQGATRLTYQLWHLGLVANRRA